MEDDLRKIKCTKTRDPKKILDNIAAVEVQYGCALSPSKKTVVVVSAGRAHYAPVIAIARTTVWANNSGRKPTAAELVAKMHKQYCIMGGGNNNATNDDEEMVETALSTFEGTCYHCGGIGHRKVQCPFLKGKGGKNNDKN